MAVRQTWGQDRVFLFADDGTQCSMPRAWTDMRDEDPFVTVAAGRSPFRVADLVAVSALVEGLRRSSDPPATVTTIMPLA